MICPRCHSICGQEKCERCGWKRRSTDELPLANTLPGSSHAPTGALAANGHTAMLQAGALLHQGNYRLTERQSQQSWLPGAHETIWLAEDLRRRDTLVRVCEVILPDTRQTTRSSIFFAAARTLRVAGRHAHLPALLDVFEDQGRGFFVFERIEGESLLARLRRIRRVMSEQEVIDCCLQLLGVLEFLAQQTPPIVHGLIQPENILVGRINGHYMLANGSIILAARATRYIMEVSRAQLSPYAAPEFGRGPLDARSDIYALVATAYFLVTGKLPVKQSGLIPPARQFNPHITPQFEAILAQGLYSGLGLRPDISLRYQHPAELRWDMLMVESMEPVG